MKLLHYVVGPVQTNCYLLINEDTDQAVIVDPGASGKALADAIQKEGFHLEAVLLTHGHFDHAGGVKDLITSFDRPIPVYALDEEKVTLQDPQLNAGLMMGLRESYEADHFLSDGEEVTLADFTLQVLATPGHTIGGCCYYLPKEHLVFTGDSLFAGSIGRTDFPLGSQEDLIASIREKLLPLPDETMVLPGHGGTSTIGKEKMQNPYL